MSDLIDTTEMYLRTIYELIEDGVTPMRARIAEQLGHSGPTVSQTVARMERDGLVVVAADRHLELTEEGERIAVRVMRKHRLAERLLLDVIGLELPFVHDEACRWEHVMSERVERRLLTMLDEPRESPYGNPIPGLAELGAAETSGVDGGEATSGDVTSPEISLLEASHLGIFSVVVSRLGESPQAAPGFLEAAVQVGLVPGATVTLERFEDRVRVVASEGELSLSDDAARHLFGRSRLGDSSRLGNMDR